MVESIELTGEEEESEATKSIKRLRQRREAYLKKVMSIVAPVVKSWYLKTSIAFLKDKQLKEEDEEIFADFTEFCTDNLDALSKHAIRLKSRDLSEKRQV